MAKPDRIGLLAVQQANEDFAVAVSDHQWVAASIVQQAEDAVRRVRGTKK